MKTALLVLCLSLASGLAGAQGWTVALTGGASINSKTHPAGYFETSGSVNPASGLQVARQRKHWETGVAGKLQQFAVLHETELRFEDEFDPLTGYATMNGKPLQYTAKERFSAISMQPFLNRRVVLGKASLFAGVHVGYTYLISVKREYSSVNIAGYRESGKHGFSAGLQAGAVCPIWRGLALRSEVAGGSWWLKNTDLLYASLSIGLQYGF